MLMPVVSTSRRQPRTAGLDRPVQEEVIARAQERPDALAVHEAGRQTSYGDLVSVAARLARRLEEAGAGGVIGVLLPRGADLAAAALAVLRTGAAYLPLDPANPPVRLARMLAAAGVRHVVTVSGLGGRLAGTAVVPLFIDSTDSTVRPPEEEAGGGTMAGTDDLAYVVFTSGSTGEPKGVMIESASFATVVRWHREYTELGPDDRGTMVYSPGFDAGIAEMWSALTAGAALYVPDRQDLLVPHRFQAWLLANRITVGYASAALADSLLRLDWPAEAPLRILMTGDDRLSGRPAPGLPFRLVNNYGPSENTVVSTAGVVEAGEEGPPPIGSPVAGAQVHVLDAEMRAVPPGVAGELYLGGPNLARGYVGRPDLTADRFVPNPFATESGQRLYRTGDLGRYRPDGSLDFLGRIDQQVKIRGFRVEPGEAAAAVRSHPQVGAVHVTARPDRASGAAELVAYVVAADPRRTPSGRELREYVADRLPEYLRPATYVLLDALPQTVTGKVDDVALPTPAGHNRPADVPYVPPATDLQRQLAEVWQEVLHVDRVGLTDRFLDLGGHSLLAVRLTARIGEVLGLDVPVDALFANPTVATLAEGRWARGTGPVAPPIPRLGTKTAPLSAIQSEAWFLDQLSPGNIAYNTQTTFRIHGELDLDVLERAMAVLVERHEMLRSTFTDAGGTPHQVVHPAGPVSVERVDLSDLAPAQRQRRLEDLVRTRCHQPFDLGALPLFRWTAIRLGPREYELLLVEHHLVHDGWSFTMLTRELTASYDALLHGRAPALPALPVQYADYAAWQREALDGPWLAGQLGYWRERLAGAPAALDLPTDRPRPKAQTFRGDLVRVELPPALPAALRKLARAEGVTLFTLMTAGFATWLNRYTGASDLCIGSGFANRRQPETQRLIGMFVNTVVLRLQVDPEAPFRRLAGTVRDVLVGGGAHQERPLAEGTRRLRPDRDPAYNPFFQVMFSFHDSPMRQPEFGGSPATVYEVANGSAKLDINVVVVPRADQQVGDQPLRDERVTVLWEYNSDLFDRSTAERMAAHYVRLLEALVADPDQAPCRMPLLDLAERAHLDRLGQGAAPTGGPAVPALVVARAATTPDTVAVADDGRRLTYRQLVAESESLARRLRARGVGAGSVVGVLLPRSADLVVAAMGALLAGAAYAPLDPVNPPARLARMLETAGIREVVTSKAFVAGVPATTADTVLLDCADRHHAGGAAAALPVEFAPESPAYVIFTSGSTGEPKAVQVPHRAFANFVGWYATATGLGAADRSAMVASPGFDATIMEIWPPLVQGGRVDVPPREVVLAPDDLARWLREHAVTVAFAPTPLAEALLDADWRHAPLRVLVAGGDRLRRRPAPGTPFRLVNVYGPTENTVVSTACDVLPDGVGAPSIGRPIDGTEVWVLDRWLQPVPVGVPGEIYLGGTGLALGYRGRPDLTADRFVPHPFARRPGQLLYRTGDLARWREDGTLQFLGRTDHQIKVRGFRLEAGEIEAALRTHPAVTDACVVARAAGGDQRLVAYLVLTGDAPGPDPLRQHLSTLLPGYMIPQEYVVMDALPLNPNGKVDRQALPQPRPPRLTGQHGPADDLERWLVEVWQELLDVPAVGVLDNVFDLGAHSLLLAQVHRRLRTHLDREIAIVALFEYPTIRALSQHLAGEVPAGSVREP
jgi:amino acid adenylation domain-containing protein